MTAPRAMVFGALLLLSLSASADLGDNSVGMNIHVGRQSFIDACADLGVGWVRMDANWFAMEPSRDSYNWAEMDAWVSRAQQAGLEVYLTLAYTPAWESRPHDSDGLSHNDVPATADEWVQFVSDAVVRYRNMNVTHFGIWNEPNLDGFFDGTVDQYVNTILVPGAAAVRSACSPWGDCKVLGPDLANVGDVDVYLQDIFARVPANIFDILAHHIYQDFVETGWNVFGGDSFINALEQQRCAIFCRKPLRDILDEAGYAGEVWITETGYRATVDDDADEHLQAVYVQRVLEEQLGRNWYTNSFFYEIQDCKPDQPDCTIDGYGLMRAISGTPGSRVYHSDFRRKEAFFALQQFIADHPEIVGAQPAAACGDGLDNDQDGLTDLADRGCDDAFDNEEGDDPARARVDAYRAGSIDLDGALTDFGADGWLMLGPEKWHGTEALSGSSDLSVNLAARWSSAGLYLALDVADDVHQNIQTPDLLWLSDSLQVAFDVAQSGGEGYDDQDDHEINFALAAGQAAGFRHHGPAGAQDTFQVAALRQASATRYEIMLPPSALPQVSWAPGTVIGFSFLVNDDDGAGRTGWIEWTPGIGIDKVPGLFGEIALLDETSAPGDPDGGPDGGPDGSDGGPDGGPDASDGTVDSGPEDGDAGPDGSDGTPDGEVDGSADGGDTGGTDSDPVDGGTGDTDGTGSSDEGCSCSSGARPSALWLGALLLPAWRRRRQR